MNIAVFASSYHPHFGGVEELCRQMSYEYRRKGHRVAVFTNRWPRSLPSYEEFEGVPVYRLALRVPSGSRSARLTYLLSYWLVRKRLLSLVRREQSDVMHVQCVSATAHYALYLREKMRLPLLVSLHGELSMDAGGDFQRSSFASALMHRSLRGADFITGCSKQTLDEAQKFAGGSFGAPAEVVYSGVPVRAFSTAEPYLHPRPYVLAIGRHVPQKGFDVLLRAWTSLDAGSHDLVLAGDGTEHERLRQLARELGIAERVHFLGQTERSTTARLFAGCEFFVLPSRHEPFGMVNLEAMSARKAVVAARVGGVAEFVLDGENGLLVPPDDPLALADAMRRLIANPMLRQTLGACGFETAGHFDSPVVASRFLSILQNLTNLRKGKSAPMGEPSAGVLPVEIEEQPREASGADRRRVCKQA